MPLFLGSMFFGGVYLPRFLLPDVAGADRRLHAARCAGAARRLDRRLAAAAAPGDNGGDRRGGRCRRRRSCSAGSERRCDDQQRWARPSDQLARARGDASTAYSPTAGWLWAPCWPSSSRHPSGLGAAPTLAVAVAAGCWIAWFVTLHPGWQSRRKLMAVYYVGLLAFAAALVAASPWYGFFAWVGYIHAFPVLPERWRIAGVTTTAALVATSQGGGLAIALSHWPLWLVLVLFNLVVAGSVSWFAMVAEQEDAKRQRLMAELGEANRQLTETVRENAGLHAQLLTQAREAGVLDERQRMAREIHDTLAQGLTGIITQLEAAEQTRDRSADWRAARGQRARAGPGEPHRGPPFGTGGPPGAAGDGPAAGRARRAGRTLVGAERGTRRGHHHRHAPPAAPGGRGDTAAGRPGGAGQRGQARRRVAGRADPVVHGGRGDARRP